MNKKKSHYIFTIIKNTINYNKLQKTKLKTIKIIVYNTNYDILILKKNKIKKDMIYRFKEFI